VGFCRHIGQFVRYTTRMDIQRPSQDDADRLAETLARLRAQQRLSQTDLKRLSGISRETISILERAHDPKKKGPPRPHPDTLRALARGLATDGKGELHDDLCERFYGELMRAAGYNNQVFNHDALGDTGLIRTEAEIERWFSEQVGEEMAVYYARAPRERRYLDPADQIGFDSMVKLYLDKAQRNRRSNPS
jgi:transcriptional regulator with XRE-family HTH domain